MEENSILKKNLSFAQDNKENEFKYVAAKVKGIEDMMEKQQIKVDSVYRRGEWKRKVNTLCDEYEKNIEILQKQYMKAVINLTANEFNANKQIIQNLINGGEPPSF